jgi:carboxypeptidase D
VYQKHCLRRIIPPDFKVDKLPNVTLDLPGSWAGSISTNTANMPNNSLFFWAYEKEDGSFLANSSEPWGIWLSGGPGYASTASLMIENGPLLVTEDNTFVENEYSWNRLADWMWVDSPIGVGYRSVAIMLCITCFVLMFVISTVQSYREH